ncbi:MAG TPA: hypothetical protein VFQ42_03995 [Mycobacterium sp.]|nr:hypothetical protein [Mycobacterium sp.]
MHRYKTWNGAMPTTGAQAAVAVANGTKTMLQLATPSTRELQMISWGFSLSAPLAGTVDLVSQDVFDTVTAHVAAGLQPLDPNAPASLLTVGTASTGYNASGQNTPTVTRVHDAQQVGGTAGDNDLVYAYQFMPDERPILGVSRFLKVRATFSATTANMLCWVVWDE